MAEYYPNINATFIGDQTVLDQTKVEDEMIFEEKPQFLKQKINNAMKNMSAG
jgi:hypothetical protein